LNENAGISKSFIPSRADGLKLSHADGLVLSRAGGLDFSCFATRQSPLPAKPAKTLFSLTAKTL